MELNHVDVVCLEFGETCLHILYDLVSRVRGGFGFRGNIQLVSDPLYGHADDVFALPIQVSPSRVNIIDAHVETGPYHLILRGKHGPEADRCHLEPCPAEGPKRGCGSPLRHEVADPSQPGGHTCGAHYPYFQKLPAVQTVTAV